MHLSTIQSSAKTTLLLDLSELNLLVDCVNIDWETDGRQKLLAKIIAILVTHLSTQVHGVVLGPEVGFAAASQVSEKAGTLFTLEKQTEVLLPNELPRLLPDWSVQHIRNNYGLLFQKLYYHPHEERAKEKKQLIAELYDSCRYEGIDLVLSLALYAPEGQPSDQATYEESQLTAAREFQAIADLLVLENPHTALAAATLTAALDIPWLVVERSQDYSQVKAAARMALEAGAAGVAVTIGNLLGGFPPLKLTNDRFADGERERLETYVQTEVRDRLVELSRILVEDRVDEHK